MIHQILQDIVVWYEHNLKFSKSHNGWCLIFQLQLQKTFSITIMFYDMYSTCFVQSTGEFYAVSRLSGATPPPPYVISRGIGWEVSL